ncbi:MAG: hypothetical protein KC422_18975, partial [Trueperaceae bacterium]|nr:hypothetical protein [Trueperaceae bacterium]
VRFQWQTTALAAQYPYDYYLDTIRVVETADPWIVRDLYLDILVYEGKRAEVVDTDDYLAAQSEGHFEAGEADFALNATHDTLNALANHGYSLRMWLESRNINLTWL